MIQLRDDQRLPWVGGVLEELAFGGEHDESHLGIAKDGDLMGLLEEPCPTLRERHLSTDLVLDPLQLNSSPPHSCGGLYGVRRRWFCFSLSIQFMNSPRSTTEFSLARSFLLSYSRKAQETLDIDWVPTVNHLEEEGGGGERREWSMKGEMILIGLWCGNEHLFYLCVGLSAFRGKENIFCVEMEMYSRILESMFLGRSPCA